MLYFFILISFAAKPSKIPSDAKVGKELFQQYCQGCHGQLEAETSKKETSNKETSDSKSPELKSSKKMEETDTHKQVPSTNTSTNEKSQSSETISPTDMNKENVSKENVSKDNSDSMLVLSTMVSSEIRINSGQIVPSITNTTYSEEDWLNWVLEGRGMMPSYNQVFHATDALKIKAYLDGL